MKRKIINIIPIVILTVFVGIFFVVLSNRLTNNSYDEVLDYINEGKVWHARTAEIDMTIYAGDLWIITYNFEEMNGIWDLSTHFIGSKEHLTISISERHNKNMQQEYGIPDTVMQVVGRIESDNLIVRFDDNTILPDEVEELTFIRENNTEAYEKMKNKIETGEVKFNEEGGNIGYTFISPKSVWKTKDINDGIYMELKENEGEKVITYNMDGVEQKAELIFPEDTEPNELTEFHLKIYTDKKIEGVEELPHKYEFNSEGEIRAILIENFGVAFIYRSKILMYFCENKLFPNNFNKVVLYKQ